jgi:nicotinate-nucleotide pyrophosphorylase (carboxylating)
MFHITSLVTNLPIKRLLKLGLEDDGWPWDWTTQGSVKDPSKKVKAQIMAKAPGIWAGAKFVQAVESLARDIANEAGSHSIDFFVAKSLVKDGTSVKPGQRVCEWSGNAGLILALERPFLNLASYVSGIATATSELVTVVKKACPKKTPRVTCTRKTLPGYRDIAVFGLQAGGGHPHRLGLSSGVLIKENHIAAAGSIAKAIEGCREVAPHGLKIEIEVTSQSELEQALSARADVIMLDNFSVDDVKKALALIEKKGSKPIIEISGGLSLSNISRYALPGVDVLSVGSLTHSVKALDLSLLIS